MGYRKCEDFGDEINLVEPGFNSRWNKMQGIWILGEEEDIIEVAPLYPENACRFVKKVNIVLLNLIPL
jgi:hypothetical protein